MHTLSLLPFSVFVPIDRAFVRPFCFFVAALPGTAETKTPHAGGKLMWELFAYIFKPMYFQPLHTNQKSKVQVPTNSKPTATAPLLLVFQVSFCWQGVKISYMEFIFKADHKYLGAGSALRSVNHQNALPSSVASFISHLSRGALLLHHAPLGA